MIPTRVGILIAMKSIITNVTVGILFFASFFAVLSFPKSAMAQLELGEQDIFVQTNPESPGSNQLVRAEVRSFAIDLDRLIITWIVNGKTITSGNGKRSITFTTGDTGTQTIVDVFVQVSNRSIIKKRIAFAPIDVDLVWEAVESYVPAFSKLRKLPGRESHIRITALPNINDIGVNNLQTDMVFNWERDGKRSINDSGFARNTFLFRNDLLREVETVSVEALSKNGGAQATREINIPFYNPEVVLYYKHDGFKRAIKEKFLLDSPRTTIVAEPYFYAADRRSIDGLKYSWYVNNQITYNPSTHKNELTVDKPSDDGATRIGVTVENQRKFLQFNPLQEIIIEY